MSPSRAVVSRWWTTRVVLPILALAASAVALGGSQFDRRSLEPFFDVASATFPLREGWFFQNVLHVGGKFAVLAVTVGLVIAAGVGWRNPRRAQRSRYYAYLVVCFLVTVGVAGLWKKVATQVTPWDTVGFGGEKPWPGSNGSSSAWDLVGSPGAHASSGFAWISLYFIGAALRTRMRWLWLAPGVLLGLLFALGQHARGAHQPSHEPWSIAIAWAVAALVAVQFRRWGWLPWSEIDDPSPLTKPAEERAAPWLVGTSIGFCGIAFFATDLFTEQLESHFAGLHGDFEFVELTITAVGFGVTAWLLTEKIQAMHAREAMRVEQERERRFQVLGRMAASVAHEVRNPLQTVRLIVDEQRHDIAGLRDHPLQAEFEASLERIDRAVDLVYRLARPETGEEERADLSAATRESVVALERILTGRVTFEWQHEPPRALVTSSRSALRIVIDNLLRNAAEASPTGSKVTLDLAARNGQWLLKIQNLGTIEPSARVDGSEPGLGLGVPISRQLAASAGGSIDFFQAKDHVVCTLHWPRDPAELS